MGYPLPPSCWCDGTDTPKGCPTPDATPKEHVARTWGFDKDIAALEAKLAEVTEERDILDTGNCDTLLDLERSRTATLRAEVARLRAAIEPTAANVEILADVAIVGGVHFERNYRDVARAILAAINARAGEVSAPGSSLRERVEAAIRHQPACMCPTMECHNDCGPALLRAALGEP